VTAHDGEQTVHFEVARHGPLVVLGVVEDGRAAQRLAHQLLIRFPDERFIGILCSDGDDDLGSSIAGLAPVLRELIFTASSSPRAIAGDTLALRALDEFGVGQDFVFTVPLLGAALAYALAAVAEGLQRGWEGTAVLVPGTPAAVAEARQWLHDSAGSA
jgi:dihydrofolate synthase/folylpolyglutamate synthase